MFELTVRCLNISFLGLKKNNFIRSVYQTAIDLKQMVIE